MFTATDRSLLAAADRHLARDCRCAYCETRVDADTAPEASAEVAAHLGVEVQALLCTRCHGDATEDLAPVPVDADAALAADPDFVTVCDARRDGAIAAQEAEGAALVAREETLLDAIRDCARTAWALWGRTAQEPSIAHRATVRALENRMGLGVDGFVSFAQVSA